MTTVQSLILDGYREANTIPLSATPTDNQNAEALRRYNALVKSMYGADVGELLLDWPTGDFGRDPSEHFEPIASIRPHLTCPPINARLIALQQAAITLDFPNRPQPGCRMAFQDPFGICGTYPLTVNGNGRPIEGAQTITFDEPNMSREWIYREDLGQWLKLTTLALTDENPFPEEFDQMFVILIAMRINPAYGRELSDLSTGILRSGRTAFLARYINSQPIHIDASLSWPFMSRQSFGYGREFASTNAFNRGAPNG